MKLRPYILFVLDSLLVFLSFYCSLAIKENGNIAFPERYTNSFLLFFGIWLTISMIFGKFRVPTRDSSFIRPLSKLLIVSGVVLGIITTLMYLTRIAFYSRTLVFGTLIIVTIVEVLFCTIYYWMRTATLQEPFLEEPGANFKTLRTLTTRLINSNLNKQGGLPRETVKKRKKTVLHELSPEAFNFIFKYIPIDSAKTQLTSTISHRNIDLLSFESVDSIVNLERVNDFRYVNKFFESVNSKLSNGGVFVDFFETKNQRKDRILRKFPPVLNYVYYMMDFMLKRVFPKFAITKRLYFIITRGENRVLTKAEAFGRLYSCGFEVIDELENDGLLFFIAVKNKEPLFPEKPTYGPLIQLNRIGKEGKTIRVYKLRTMHPYSEFLQDYIYQKEGLQEGGKFKDDFRISNLGKFFRMFWLDELPMLLNLIRGDMKIVGIRPLSNHYFNLYTEEHKKRRIKYKPGLVPPFYADNPKTLSEIMASERKYMSAYDKHPIRTDFRYFFSAFYNIIFKKLRSA